MNFFELFRKEVTIDIFDYQLLAQYLPLKKKRDKVSLLVNEGKIVRLKKGLYIFGENWRKGPINLEIIANLLYGPSCVSFEYALNHYGLIAERTEIITSLTMGDSKRFNTPFGQFEYQATSKDKFQIGIEYRDLGKEGGYFIASREKALCDLVYRTSGIRTPEQLKHFLFEEMRVDESQFQQFDFQRIGEIAKIYKKHSVTMLSKL